MKKFISKKMRAITSLVLAITIFVTGFRSVTLVSAYEYTKGDIIEPEKSAGNIEQAGDVSLKKTISATDEMGVYNVTLEVKGKDKIITESQTGSIYTVVVLDTSGSMKNYCDGNYGIITGKCYGTIVKKYDNAINGAKTFATNLLTKYKSSQLALVTFSSDAIINRDFASKDFSDVNFPSANGGTNLGLAIQKSANLLLQNKNNNPNAKLYMVILSDGYPEGQTVDHNKAAKYAKDNGIEIFTIGYDTNDETEKILKSVATDEYHYKTASVSNITDMFNDILSDIKIPVPAGTNATITDVIADGFTYVENSASEEALVDGQNIQFNIGNITENGTIVSFKIKANSDLEDGLHRTNDLAKVDYTNSDGNYDKLEITDSSKIYWEQDKYTYMVNYKEKDTDNMLANSKIITDALYNETYQEQALDITGYNVVGDDIQSILIDEDNKIMTFYYTKKNDLSYIVEYYNDDLSNKLGFNSFTNQTFGDTIEASFIDINKYQTLGYNNGIIITEMPHVIIDGDNIIQVLYQKREDMTYTVRYLDKETNEAILNSEVRTDCKYLETYEEFAKDAPAGYKLVGNAMQTVLVNDIDKVVTFYYSKREDMTYTVNYKEKDTDNMLANSKIITNALYNETYQEQALDITGYNVVGDDIQSILIDEDNKVITFYYTKKNDLSYRVEYYYDNVLDATKTDYFTNMTYGTTIDSYKDKNIDGYLFVKDTGTIVIDDDTDNVIKVYYEQDNSKIENDFIEDIQPPKTGVETALPISLILLPIAFIIFFRKSINLKK